MQARKEAAVISLLWENKRLIYFVMLSSSVSEYSSWITSQQNRSHLVHADMQCDGISPQLTAEMVMQCGKNWKKLTKSVLRYFKTAYMLKMLVLISVLHYWHLLTC